MQNAFPVDEAYMRRALALAKEGLGAASPNPMVGCVIVCRNRIIGEGFHHRCGEAHAEVNAINAVLNECAATRGLMRETGRDARTLLQESTLYVTLEPCAHYGKTPPCAEKIVEMKIPRVVVCCADPNPKVNGGGIAILKAAGVEVVEHVLEKEGRELGRRFFLNMERKRPYVILKWAQTADGLITDRKGRPYAITGPLLNALNHAYRAQEDAIMVGTDTLLSDNPMLNARRYAASRQPLRISLDLHGRILDFLRQDAAESPAARIPLHFLDGTQPSLLFVREENVQDYAPWKENVELVGVPATVPPLDRLSFYLQVLHERHIGSLIVEGGAELLQSFITQNLWDEARVFSSPKTLGTGYAAPHLPAVKTVENREYAGEWVHVFKPVDRK